MRRGFLSVCAALGVLGFALPAHGEPPAHASAFGHHRAIHGQALGLQRHAGVGVIAVKTSVHAVNAVHAVTAPAAARAAMSAGGETRSLLATEVAAAAAPNSATGVAAAAAPKAAQPAPTAAAAEARDAPAGGRPTVRLVVDCFVR